MSLAIRCALMVFTAALFVPAAYAGEALPSSPVSTVATVKYRSLNHVYLDVGSASRVTVGQRFQIVRDGERIALIEVVFVARRSASCTIIEEQVTIAAGDEVRTESGEALGRERDSAAALRPGQRPGEQAGTATEKAGYEQSSSRAAVHRPSWQTRQRLSGAFSFGWETFLNGQSGGREYSRLIFRGDLRLRNIGGSPYTVNVRGSTRRIARESFGLSVLRRETRSRLYEVSVHYDPPDGKFAFSAGRLGTTPFAGNGNLDGAVGEVRITPRLGVGGYFGSIPDVQFIGFGFDRTRYGAFARFTRSAPADGSHLQCLVGAARENAAADWNRTVAYLETIYRAGRRISLFQRAELDLDRPDTEQDPEGGDTSSLALASFLVTGLVETSPGNRLSVSFDHWNRAPNITGEDGLPLLINQMARSGLTAAYYFEGPAGSRMTVRGGTRWQEGGEATVYFGGFNVFRTTAGRWRFGGSAQFFSGNLQDGVTLSLNAGKRWRSFGLMGSYNGLVPIGSDERAVNGQWIRVLGDFDITRRAFIEAGLEFNMGDYREGTRLTTGLGYRF
jgi:hypothetical protein